ncbi:MAG TPA: Crp/Fnr family transcriptional regulator [Candidatus Acidoferrales bacterium]|jgi:CRP-like cAMP-binding protein|nr:Crp/Fnr family transcriptional regulator [Candidatus Acidoferrales bacterium]
MPRAKTAARSVETVRNSLLLDLPPNQRAAVRAKMQFVELPLRTVLNEAEEPIEFAYFINGGCASILSVMPDGKSVEVGLVGFEGFVGSPLLAGFRTSPTRAIMQVPGAGFRIAAQDLPSLLAEFPSLLAGLGRYNQELAIQAIQTAGCNRLHEVEQRLARWLLMTQDRVGDSFELTQEFIAHMLGTRRATVTITTGVLQKAGLITYTRGRVHIKNRPGLEISACECYAAIRRHIAAWRKDRRDADVERPQPQRRVADD